MKKLTIPTAEPFFLPAGKIGCVLVHGFTGAPKEMRLMGESLHNNGITVMGIRLAGHATNINDMPRTKWRDWLASVEDGINLLSGRCDQIFIAGLSMGGILALLSASIYPLQGAIAMSTPYSINNGWRVKFARPISIFMPFVDKEKSDTTDNENAKTHVDYPAYPTRSIAELTDMLKALHENLQNIQIPVLIVNSKGDSTVPMSHQEKYTQNLPENLAETVILEKSGHVVTEDVEREIVFKAAFDFIKKHSLKNK